MFQEINVKYYGIYKSTNKKKLNFEETETISSVDLLSKYMSAEEKAHDFDDKSFITDSRAETPPVPEHSPRYVKDKNISLLIFFLSLFIVNMS